MEKIKEFLNDLLLKLGLLTVVASFGFPIVTLGLCIAIVVLGTLAGIVINIVKALPYILLFVVVLYLIDELSNDEL